MPPRYYIPNHVHFAIDKDVAVFMDVRSDQYSLLVGEKARMFATLVSYGEKGSFRTLRLPSTGGCELTVSATPVLAELLQCHLISTAPPEVASQSLITLPLPEETLLSSYELAKPEYTLFDLLRLVRSLMATKWRLSTSSIEHILTLIGTRRREYRAAGTLPVHEVRRLVCIYNYFRPLFPKDYVCLFDSLALLDFLWKYNCLPHLVFAVTLEPWEAHCWVQAGTVSFNEDAETARSYLQMLVV